MDDFKIGDQVVINLTRLNGEVVGIYDYKNMLRRYTVRYADMSGVVREDAFEIVDLQRAA